MFLSSKSNFTFIILIFSLLFQSCYGRNAYLYNFCSTRYNFTINDGHYGTNLNKLMNYLTLKAPPLNFALGSIGNTTVDKAYGLALCRGDVVKTDCKSCIEEAIQEIGQRCPYSKESVIWYDNCMLKYTNSNFFGEIDNQNRFYMYNLRNVSEPMTFNKRTKELLSKLTIEASSNSKLYAAGEMELGGEFKMLYGLAQCTRDLSSNTCKMCLEGIVSELPNCCDGKEGGRIVGASCNFRYEIYPFLNNA